MAGWKVYATVAEPQKSVICVAPHTSNWDFILGELGIHSVGMKAGFLMKDTWFFFPLGYLMKALGGIPVNRRQHGNLTQSIVEAFNTTPRLAIGVTPEGTRSANPNWHKGAIFMAREAQVPLVMAYFDYKQRVVCIDREFQLSDDADADLIRIKQYFLQHGCGRFPEKFVTGLE